MKIITCTIIAAFFLSSCSNQRYGAISKVKHPSKTDNNHVVAKKTIKPETVVVNSNQSLDIQLPEVEQTVAVTPVEVMIPEAVQPQVNQPKKAKAFEKEITRISRFTLPLFPEVSNQSQKITERKVFQKDQNINETQAARGWFYYIVVGLIFLLLAGLFFDTLAGAIFGLVGLIAIIYGLLALIDIV